MILPQRLNSMCTIDLPLRMMRVAQHAQLKRVSLCGWTAQTGRAGQRNLSKRAAANPPPRLPRLRRCSQPVLFWETFQCVSYHMHLFFKSCGMAVLRL